MNSNQIKTQGAETINVAKNSNNGHYLKGANKVIEVDGAPENYLLDVDEGAELKMSSKNHGDLKIKCTGNTFVIHHQDEINEIRQSVIARRD